MEQLAQAGGEPIAPAEESLPETGESVAIPAGEVAPVTLEAASGGASADTAEAVESPDPSAPEPEVPLALAEPVQRDAGLKALIEGIVYITDEPLTPKQIAAGVDRPIEEVEAVLAELVEEYARPDRGLSVREIAGGYKLSTKAEHHERIRAFVKTQKPQFKLSLPALETLAVIAYKQPITAPEIQEIRGVQGTGVLKTLLDRKLITTAGRKAVIGKPILYKTTRDFLLQFGLKDLSELPTLKEFEELQRLALDDDPLPADTAPAPAVAVTDPPAAAETATVSGETPEPVAVEVDPSHG